MADNDGSDEWIADAPNSGVEKISVKDNPLGSRDVDALIPTTAAKAASVPLSDFMELSSTEMERFFQPEVIWALSILISMPRSSNMPSKITLRSVSMVICELSNMHSVVLHSVRGVINGIIQRD